MIKKTNGINIRVDQNFYDKIERERRKFMKKHKLTKLSTTAFTGVLVKRLV